MTLVDYVKRYYYGNFVEFSRCCGVTRVVAQKWVKGGAYVIDHVMFSPYRRLGVPITIKKGLIDPKFISLSHQYFVVSLAHTLRDNPYIKLWGADDCGYCGRVETAGRYTSERIMKRLCYYNDGESTVAVPCDLAVHLAVKVQPGFFDDNNGRWIPNTRENWRELLDNVICEPRNRPWPEFSGAPRNKENVNV